MAIKRKIGLGDKVTINGTNISGQVVAKVDYYRGQTDMLVRYSTGNSVGEHWVTEQLLTAVKPAKKKVAKKTAKKV